MANDLDNETLDKTSFAFRDIRGFDRWEPWTPVFGSITVVGATAYSGRLRFVGKLLQMQVQFSAATSIASVAGTDFLTLPVAAKGLSGMGVMTNASAKTAVGLCHLDVATSRLYLPAQVASGNVFNLYSEFEV